MDPRHAPLFEPLTLPSGIALANRIAIAPMTTWSSHPDATIHDDELAYLRRRSRGPALVITAACYVRTHGHAFPGQWGCHDDAMLPSLRAAADAIRTGGAVPVLQLHHGGRMCPAALLGHAPLSASDIPALRPDADVPRPMTEEEIVDTIDAFAEGTRRAAEAGYDGVEVHGANTYLQQQFFSPHSNCRTDAWGGDVRARMRFPLATLRAALEAARAAVPGRPFAVGYRLSPEEIEEPGITLDDTLLLVEELAALAPDWIHVSLRDYMRGSIRDKTDRRRPARVIIDALAGAVPVISAGSLGSPEAAVSALEDGNAMAALARPVLMEPEWVEKVRAGESASIRATLPATGGDAVLTLPGPMYRRLLSVPGWLPVSSD